VTYSIGAPGEVMLDGTQSDPVECPSPYSSIRFRQSPFGVWSPRPPREP